MKHDYIAPLRDVSVPIEKLSPYEASIFYWLAQAIREGKAPLRSNTVDLIVADILDSQGRIRNFRKRGYFDVFVFGTFRKSFTPVASVAEAFAEFYMELKILPNIIAIPKHRFLEDRRRFMREIHGGVILYEKR